MREIYWVGTSLTDLKKLPDDVIQMAGYQLYLVQSGMNPSDWKPMKSIGQGVREIRIRLSKNAYRIIYVAVNRNSVYVLHSFQKKTQNTSAKDINLAKRRYNEVMRAE
jgi:phage-related protein